MSRRVAVIGGGYTGAAQAIALQRAGAHPILIERVGEPGRGVAYATRHDDHLLNVRAGSMSAFADAPSHFAEWFVRQGGDAAGFAPRKLYGRYIAEQLAEAGVEIMRGEAVAIAPGGADVTLADGRTIAADAAVLAVGNLPPATPGGLSPELRASPLYVPDPWAVDIAAGLGPDDTVLLIGTGLTAIDMALILDSAGFEGSTLALSRRGLAPRAHVAPGSVTPVSEPPAPPKGSALLREVRETAEQIGWRAAVDRLRPVTQQLWREGSDADRARFLRHLRPWWDVHRHRIAPSIAARIADMEEAGRLLFAGGRILDADLAGGRAEVRWQPRGSSAIETITVARIVNCTGPLADIRKAGDPLLDALLGDGRIRPDALRLGIDVDDEGRVLHADGSADAHLRAVGPLTKGALWEVVAVPDIRVQVQAMAERLA